MQIFKQNEQSFLRQAYRSGKQVFVIRNGGSASTASHMACDLGKNILPERDRDSVPRLHIMALTDNVGWMTALANDIGYDDIFSKQLKDFVQADDLLIAISGSGNSPNVVKGVEIAKAMGAKTVGLLGFRGGKVSDLLDARIIVPSDNYGYIEDIHLVLNHLFVALLKMLVVEEISETTTKDML